MNKQDIHIAVATDDVFAPHTATLIASILCNKLKNENIIIYVLHDNISLENKQRLQQLTSVSPFTLNFVKIVSKLFADFPSSQFTICTYYRLLIPILLSKYAHRILYIDSDAVVQTSLSELYNSVLPSSCFLGVVPDILGYIKDIPSRKEILGIHSKKPYFNAGVLLFDFARMADVEGFLSKCLNWAIHNVQRLRFEEQDILNALFHQQYSVLPLKYNYSTSFEVNYNFYKEKLPELRAVKQNLVIIHYATISAQKPWLYYSIDPCRRFYRKYRKLTAWANEPLPDDKLLARVIMPLRLLRNYFRQHGRPLSIPT